MDYLVSEPLPDWIGTVLSFDVSPGDNGGSRLYFRHSGLTPQLECFDFCSTSWKGYLASLASYLYTGKGSPFGLGPGAGSGTDLARIST